MNGDEKVGMRSVGYFCPFTKLYEFVFISGEHHFQLRKTLFYAFGKPFAISKVKVFRSFSYPCSLRLHLSAMTCIYYYGIKAETILTGKRCNAAKKQRQDNTDCAFHKIIVLLYFANLTKKLN